MQDPRLLRLVLLCGMAPLTWAGPPGSKGAEGAERAEGERGVPADRGLKGDTGAHHSLNLRSYYQRACRASLERSSVNANTIRDIVNKNGGEKFRKAPRENENEGARGPKGRPGNPEGPGEPGKERPGVPPCGLESSGGDESAHGCCLQSCGFGPLSSAMDLFGKRISLYRGGAQQFHTCRCRTRSCAHKCECLQGQRAVMAMTSSSGFDYVWIDSCCRSVFTG